MLAVLDFWVEEAEKRQRQAGEGKRGTNGVSQCVSITADPDLDAAPPVPRQQAAAPPQPQQPQQAPEQQQAPPAQQGDQPRDQGQPAADTLPTFPPPYAPDTTPTGLQIVLNEQLREFERRAAQLIRQEAAARENNNASGGPYAPLTRELRQLEQGLTQREREQVESASGQTPVSGNTRSQREQKTIKQEPEPAMPAIPIPREEHWPPPPPPPPAPTGHWPSPPPPPAGYGPTPPLWPTPGAPPAGRYPMVEVAGTEGVLMVHRHWTESDIIEAASSLPHPANVGGERFGRVLLDFARSCRPTATELKRLLVRKLGSHFCKIDRGWPEADLRLRSTEWQPAEGQPDPNRAYRTMITDLQERLRTAFPPTINTARIAACTQRDGELVQDYLVRLTQVHNDFSGLEQPERRAEGTEGVSAWESHLRNSFILGLRPDIADAVRTFCVAYGKQPLSVIEDHARHHEARLAQQGRRKEQKQNNTMNQAMLTMVQQTTLQGGKERGRGETRQANREGNNPGWDKRCYRCGQEGHFARRCKAKKGKRPQLTPEEAGEN
ncbi:uncharacterized protein [Salminus brasiliensis]|uniref:uncharacterized protein n=1 Tax=Salminus brasiliensis TaxID=930266 RepID=UPI003B8353D7